MARVRTWNARPATMMLSPVSGLLFECEAVLASPPPAAWRRRDIRSQGMNYLSLAKSPAISKSRRGGDIQSSYKPRD